ncbi:Re/Si-specific NAD(P)(+) transhydrogenase subunit alpha [Pararhizobium mangrovi]|uniref:NAD(P) transhydrogenase subunit alpha part 1 n=1 Tax=Pararhizobium mangrovi TaxID=2590452 RepID=A0A506U9X1_9HYPH|nr:Re/Si-specific NAD(P)(+) transhydrogenase subunit alpha [Pararhizobium mangrovi]TPW30670.1 Re/Si-specific NAD(P)(+) transhydrogenase subunit alpha [Pararhizobium mangrovi]
MATTVFVAREADAGEPRVAASLETVKRMKGLGFDVLLERGAGEGSRIPDAAFEEAGAELVEAKDAGRADVVLKVRRPSAAEMQAYKSGALVIALMNPFDNDAAIAALAKAGVTAFSMELLPRITRAQSMDVLSSQANLAGYQAVIEAASEFDRAMPMMMTAAGTVPAARVFVMGAGVAGLQAIATARRLGGSVSASDVRPAAKEQVASLGAKFVAVEDEEFRQAETAGGYAREMSKEYQEKQAELIAEHVAKQDMVITTALIPGRPAPKLVSRAMLKSMKPGSVAVDLAVERGGNIEGSEPGKVVDVEGVRVVGYTNMAGRIATSASVLYAKNLFTFLEALIDKETKEIKLDPEDQIVKATMLTRDGKVVHENFQSAAKAEPESAQTDDAAKAKSGSGKGSRPAGRKTGGANEAGAGTSGAKASDTRASDIKASGTEAATATPAETSGEADDAPAKKLDEPSGDAPDGASTGTPGDTRSGNDETNT